MFLRYLSRKEIVLTDGWREHKQKMAFSQVSLVDLTSIQHHMAWSLFLKIPTPIGRNKWTWMFTVNRMTKSTVLQSPDRVIYRN